MSSVAGMIGLAIIDTLFNSIALFEIMSVGD
jgi:formate hydrogenlyase subunit 3/multisubunit Na+/H+ antiporter MnhD subunit